jgi:hypothetical protein
MFWARISLLLAAWFVAVSVAPASTGPSRIVAIGDLHGDYDAWRTITTAARIVDRGGHWAGGRTILVQTGDVPDRGPDTLKIIEELMRLQREARRAGGQVIALVGNHEAMNVTGDLRYIHPGEYAAFADRTSEKRRANLYYANSERIEAAYRAQNPRLSGDQIRAAWIASMPLGRIEHQQAWAPNGRIGRWIVTNPAVAVIDGTLFVHGGISVDYAQTSVDEINRRATAALKARATAMDSIINDPRGPLWYRGLVTRDQRDAEVPPEAVPAATSPPIEQELDTVLRAYGAQRIVIGHTPSLSGIQALHGGRLVRIDTGISRHYAGKLTWLEIADGKLLPHEVPRPGGN